MPRDTYVAARCSEIHDRLQYAADKSRHDDELGAYLADYISVLISGVVETSVEHLVVQRAAQAADPELQQFVRSAIDQQFRNPRSDDISQVLGRFSDSYRTAYQNTVSREAREALGSIVGNRIALSHRGQSQSRLTVNDVRRYFGLIVGILEVVEELLIHDRTQVQAPT